MNSTTRETKAMSTNGGNVGTSVICSGLYYLCFFFTILLLLCGCGRLPVGAGAGETTPRSTGTAQQPSRKDGSGGAPPARGSSGRPPRAAGNSGGKADTGGANGSWGAVDGGKSRGGVGSGSGGHGADQGGGSGGNQSQSQSQKSGTSTATELDSVGLVNDLWSGRRLPNEVATSILDCTKNEKGDPTCREIAQLLFDGAVRSPINAREGLGLLMQLLRAIEIEVKRASTKVHECEFAYFNCVLQDGMDGVRFRTDAAPAPLRAPCVPLGSTPHVPPSFPTLNVC
jgi:hypothetical protein